MKIGLVGLGKMGLNLGRNLLDHNYEVVMCDVNQTAVKELQTYGTADTASLEQFMGSLVMQRTLWIEVPHSVIDSGGFG